MADRVGIASGHGAELFVRHAADVLRTVVV
jgi:hypothetical protein